MITLCFLNFHVPFRTNLSYKLQVTPFLLSEDEHIFLDLKGEKQYKGGKSNTLPKTALSHDPSTEKQASVDSAYNSASFIERGNSQAHRKPISK